MPKLSESVAIVTGAGRGIGLAIAEALHEAGARVVAADISGEQDELAGSLGERASSVHADVSDDRSVQAMVEHTLTTFGRIDVLVNNAGIDGGSATLGECTAENFDHVIAVNLRGVFLGMRYAIPEMVQTGGGSIVNIASIAAILGIPNLGPYAASKAGVMGLTRSAAVEFAKAGIRVNAILPGWVKTPLAAQMEIDAPETVGAVIRAAESRAPMGRGAETSEIAQLAVYLASDASSFITGVGIPADGGYTVN